MSRNGSGTYVPPAGNPVSPATVIESAWANTIVTDFGNEITNSLPRDGQAAMTGVLKITSGTVAAPGVAFNSEASTGLYRVSSNVMGFAVGGAQKLRLTSTGAAITGTTDISGNTTVGGTLAITGAATLSSTLAVTGNSTVGGNLAVTGTISGSNFTGFANPTAVANLSAINGSATTAMRSDAAPAIDQAISPSWTGSHTFRGQLWTYPTAGTAVLRIRAATDTTQDASWLQWYQANGTTERAWLGFGSNGSNTFTIQNQLSNQNIVFATSGGTTLVNSGNFSVASGLTTLNSGSSGANTIVNSSHANGPYITLQRSGTAFGDIGCGVQIGSSFTADSLAFGARPGNNVEFSANGSASPHLRINTSGQVLVTDGTTGAPAIGFRTDTNTGIHLGAGDDMYLGAGGSAYLRVVASSMPVRVQGGQLGITAGSVSAPGIAFDGDANTGMYAVSTDQIGFTAGGTLRLTVNTDGTLFREGDQAKFGDGSVSAPPITFTNDANTGLYRVGGDQLGIASGGSLVLQAGHQNYDVFAPRSGSLGTGASFGNGSVGVQLGSSGGGYSALGCNVRFTGTGNTYQYHVGDTASLIDFHSGGIRFYTAPSGTAGSTISFSNTFSLDRASNTVNSYVLHQFNTSGGGESARIVGNTGYLSFYNGSNNTRRGFLQMSTSGDAMLASEESSRNLKLYTNSGKVQFTENAGTTYYDVGYRSIPQTATSSSSYTLLTSDVGKHIRYAASSGGTITIPPSVFSIGDAITLVGWSSGAHTLARGSGVALYWAGTNFANANRTLTNCFTVTVLCVATNEFVVSGVGIS